MGDAKWQFLTELLKVTGPVLTTFLAWLLPSPWEILRRKQVRLQALEAQKEKAPNG